MVQSAAGRIWNSSLNCMKRKTLIGIATLIPLVMIAIALLSLPEPDFEIIEDAKGYELRRYEPFNVAQTRVEGSFENASRPAFERLVGYVQGGNGGGRNLPMMAPVTQQAVGDGESVEWLFQFMMPKEYPMSYLPAPADERVSLQTVPGRLVAARRYRGSWDEPRYRRHETELLEALSDAGLAVIGTPIFARYNAPFVPGFLRRNEVLVEVSAD
jgi:effector-binding domain-containing protein